MTKPSETAVLQIEVYSDVACPWCYIGKRRLELAVSNLGDDLQVEVSFRPYQLDPDAPVPGVPLPEYLTRRFGNAAASKMGQVADAARSEGLVIDFGSAIAANTFDAHRLLGLAEREHGAALQRALAGALFEAHFARGFDIGDREALVRIAGEAGMDARRTRTFLDSDESEKELRAEIAQARRLGITAVPTFVLAGRYAVPGAQHPAVLARAIEAVSRETGSANATGNEGGATT